MLVVDLQVMVILILAGYRPVIKAARVGEHTGAAAYSEPQTGGKPINVGRSVLAMPSSQPRSSIRMKIMSGWARVALRCLPSEQQGVLRGPDIGIRV